MNILIIGGTGIISTAVVRELLAQGHAVSVLNRGNHPGKLPQGARLLRADIADDGAVRTLLRGQAFDAAANFIAFRPEDVARDMERLQGMVGQYIFISSASAYQKPLVDWRITEGTPLANPHWAYARNKIACEDLLMEAYRANGFPFTVVRPSHTYDETFVPLAIAGRNGFWQVLERMRAGKHTILHGDGTSLWTLTHARDFAVAFAGLVGNIHAVGQAVNVTGDETLTWNQVYECIARALGVSLRPFYASSMFLARASDYDMESCMLGERAHSAVFINTKLKQLVPGFTQKIRFDQGIRDTIAHVLADPTLQVADPEFDRWCDALVKNLTAAAAATLREAGMEAGK